MTAEEEHARDLDLLQRWNTTLLAARSGREGPDPAPYGRNLLSRWAEPQRRYHTVDHLRAVLDRIDELADQGGEGGELELVRLAAWFHDAVYRPDRSENEERSAALAEKALTEAGLTPHEVTEVARLVRLTTSHDPAAGDLNGETLCDADLAILATDPDTYGGYAAAVREEYAFVPEPAFREGRATVLRHLLGLPRLFRTPYGAAVWEEKARANMERELAELTTEPAGEGREQPEARP
ncbi:HD domain-containing protein [Streptomyces vietnamensis]|uniref:HD domain-containing protein n=1 Tax=Streptomyces vietnamensis TaxID=362257 RepID=UPI003415D2C1